MLNSKCIFLSFRKKLIHLCLESGIIMTITYCLSAVIYNFSKNDTTGIRITFPVIDYSEILDQIKYTKGDYISIEDFELNVSYNNKSKVYNLLFDPITIHSTKDIVVNVFLKHLNRFAKNLNYYGKSGVTLLDLYNQLDSSQKSNIDMPDVIIPYDSDEDLDQLFANQAPHEILHHQGDINFNDDYLTQDLNTLQVNTLTNIGLDHLLQKNITDIVNVYLRHLE